MKKEIIITDQEFCDKKINPFTQLASTAGEVDRRAGYATKLINRNYDPDTFTHHFIVERYED